MLYDSGLPVRSCCESSVLKNVGLHGDRQQLREHQSRPNDGGGHTEMSAERVAVSLNLEYRSCDL